MAKLPKKLNKAMQAKLDKLNNRWWRLNNLYFITTEQGERVQFKPNKVQEVLYFALWWLNVIPKSRQHGITTFIAIFLLDACLFNSGVRAGIIAHRLEDAKRILRDKIKYAYANLPRDLQNARPLIKENETEIEIKQFDADGKQLPSSSIYVGTSMRSGTLQYLHVSEYGKLCARTPLKAKEVMTGAMETIHEGGMIFVESTAEGPFGDFYEMCKEAETNIGRELGKLQYKMHFFGWHDKESNITNPEYTTITEDNDVYFGKIEKVFNKVLTRAQKAWYVEKKKRLKQDIYKEHPSIVDECFLSAVEGAYYSAEVAQMREEGRIGDVPHNAGYPVHTVCDVGTAPNMPWLFFQQIGQRINIINEFCMDKRTDERTGIIFYRKVLDGFREDYKYNYGKHFAPFDIKKTEVSTGQSVLKTAAQLGIHFKQLEVEKSKLDGIERLTNQFPMISIDAEKCPNLIKGLTAYHREWMESAGVYSEHPKHDAASHWADAARYLSMVVEKNLGEQRPALTDNQIAAMARKYRRTG